MVQPSANGNADLPKGCYHVRQQKTEVKFKEAHRFLNGKDFNSKDELFISVV